MNPDQPEASGSRSRPGPAGTFKHANSDPDQPEASSSRPRTGPSVSSSSPFCSSTSSPSSSSETIYTFSPHPEHTDPSFRPSPIDVALAPSPNLREAPNADLIPPVRPTLAQFRQAEGPEVRSAKLKGLWEALPTLPSLHDEEGPSETKRMKLPGQDTMTALSPERADRLRRLYEEELVRRCNEERPQARLWGGPDEQGEKNIGGKGVRFEAFRRFLWDQESHLWDMFQELDKNGDGRLDATEMRAALSRAGIDITPATVTDLVRFLVSGAEQKGQRGPAASAAPAASAGSASTSTSTGQNNKGDMYITFPEFRDFLIMLPREATPFEIYKFYQVRKRSLDGRGAARVDKEGDINISFPKRPPTPPGSSKTPASSSSSASSSGSGSGPSAGLGSDKNDGGIGDTAQGGQDDGYGDTVDVDEDQGHQGGGNEAWRFLLAGGIAGAVSRSVTAPFDRLKVYLITTGNTHIDPKATSPSSLSHPFRTSTRAVANLWGAMGRIYADGGGVRAFWVGNGLNVMKIFPESAIKFVSYEHSKVLLAQYWDNVSDVSELSSSSRFFAGGVGGITSQFAIYGLETLKTRIQTDLGPATGMKGVGRTMREMWAAGGIRVFYRGLTLGLVGVFPYSAIDMGTYETLKRAYCRSTGKDEPEVIATLGFGALSGSIGAASVYPINLLRTRLQASGSSGHPQKYTGFRDVLSQTLQKEGWRGLYKGLLPSILKVGPAVGVSWIVYEDAKRRLGAGQ